MLKVVTGGGGFLGGQIVHQLAEKGERIRVVGRRRYPDLERQGVDGRVADIRDADALIAAFQGADTVFHAAAMTGVWGRKKDFYETNIRGTANVIRACLENKVRHLIYTSSPSVVIEGDIRGGDETLPYPARYLAHYPATKAAAERMVLDADGWEMVVEERADGDAASRAPKSGIRRLRTCAIRPHLIWGPGDPHLIPRIIDAARKGRLRRVGSGTNKVDLTYVVNAADAHLLAAENLAHSGTAAGKAYFIGDARPVVLWDWIDALLQRLRIAPVSRALPLVWAMRASAVLELLHTAFPALGEPRLTRFVATQLATNHYFSHGRAATDLGYTPKVDSETGLQALIAWLQRQEESDGPPDGAT